MVAVVLLVLVELVEPFYAVSISVLAELVVVVVEVVVEQQQLLLLLMVVVVVVVMVEISVVVPQPAVVAVVAAVAFLPSGNSQGAVEQQSLLTVEVGKDIDAVAAAAVVAAAAASVSVVASVASYAVDAPVVYTAAVVAVVVVNVQSLVSQTARGIVAARIISPEKRKRFPPSPVSQTTESKAKFCPVEQRQRGLSLSS